jgi:hypothetical protein
MDLESWIKIIMKHIKQAVSRAAGENVTKV